MCNLISYAFPFVNIQFREQVILHACVVTGNGDISPYCPSFYDGTDSDFVVEQLSRGSVHVAKAKHETWHTKK